MKKYSIISSILFIILTIVFYQIPRTEIKSAFISQTQLGTNPILSSWKVKTTHAEFISPNSVDNFNDKTVYLGKEFFGDDVVYFRSAYYYDKGNVFVKGIHTKDYGYIFISLLMGLQFFILIGFNPKKEHLFLNAFCILLIVLQFIYMLRVWII